MAINLAQFGLIYSHLKVSVACLFFYIFNPYHDNTYLIDRETKVLFYLFGIIFIISADWDVFLDMQNDTK